MNEDMRLDDEKIEGLDQSGSVGWGEYPLDSVFVRTEQRTVREVIRRIEAKRYDLSPDFQRDFVWPIDKQSRLIESCLMRIPLPVFYVAEGKDGRIIVVDGLQRLTTFKRFLNNDFPLTSLGDGDKATKGNTPLTGKRFKNLPINLQERIEDTQLTLYILDAKAPERAKLDIFERVNGGVPLTRQQMRNCLYNGAATIWLKAAADSESFLTVTGQSLDKKSMRDREAINRFCAFRLLGVDKYKGDMDGFLAETLEKMNQLSKAELTSLRERFDHAMRVNRSLFNNHAFRKSLASDDEHTGRSVINIAFFDVCSVLLAEVDEKLLERNADRLKERIRELIKGSTFNHAITYSTNSAKQVETRFDLARAAIKELIEC
jgi:hypothetical protein